jgi:hypothetical protein
MRFLRPVSCNLKNIFIPEANFKIAKYGGKNKVREGIKLRIKGKSIELLLPV